MESTIEKATRSNRNNKSGIPADFLNQPVLMQALLTKDLIPKLSQLEPGQYGIGDVIDIDLLCENNHRIIDEESRDYKKTFDSILLAGILEPIRIFYDLYNASGPSIVIIAGHTRTRIVKAIREFKPETKLPAILEIPKLGDTKEDAIKRYLTAAVTNIVRSKLRGIERARAIQDLVKVGMKNDQISLALGVNRKVVERSKNLLILPEEIQRFVTENISKLRENRVFDIAQKYKNMLNDGKEVDALEKCKRDLLDELKNTRKVASKKRGLIVDIEQFKARLVIAQISNSSIEKIVAILQESRSEDSES
jgi:vacuolar-type H+-ATPase subunit F/Vma7